MAPTIPSCARTNTITGPTRFPKAYALAKLQTAYEWCRLVTRAGQTRTGADGVLLALWVTEGASPHPANTPCARTAARGPVGVRVTVDRVKVLEDQDNDEDSAGQINLSLAMYDPPSSFHQSVKSKVGPIYADDDATSSFVGANVPGVGAALSRGRPDASGWLSMAGTTTRAATRVPKVPPTATTTETTARRWTSSQGSPQSTR